VGPGRSWGGDRDGGCGGRARLAAGVCGTRRRSRARAWGAGVGPCPLGRATGCGQCHGGSHDGGCRASDRALLVVAAGTGEKPEETQGSSAASRERRRGPWRRRPRPGRGSHAQGGWGTVLSPGAGSVPPAPCPCPRRAALIAWGVLSVLGGAFVCGQSAALAVLGLLR